MKRAGDYLAAIIDADLFKKAKTYSGFFSSWAQICQNCGIAAAAGYSRIRNLEKGILVVEADHPGWVQILQTKAQWVLNHAQRRFPELDIRGISLTLSKGEAAVLRREEDPLSSSQTSPQSAPQPCPASESPRQDGRGVPSRPDSWDRIEDKDFKDTLKRLEQSIRERERSGPKTGREKQRPR
ncbi:MAG: DUF721 domain-containing protein [Treponema sp.]|jgi:hypothetical protein|nr:DUF721 domain-containing protein [Treponema sp.]